MNYKDELQCIRIPKKVYDKIEAAVVGLFVELNISSFPIDPFDIVKRKGYILHTYSELLSEVRQELVQRKLEATSMFNPVLGTYMIYYDETKSLGRIRFTIMHEVGHIVLGHKQESDLAKMMANYFAAYSLAPSPIIMQYNCENSQDIAEAFDISMESADHTYKRYKNWYDYGGPMREYENELIELFNLAEKEVKK